MTWCASRCRKASLHKENTAVSLILNKVYGLVILFIRTNWSRLKSEHDNLYLDISEKNPKLFVSRIKSGIHLLLKYALL